MQLTENMIAELLPQQLLDNELLMDLYDMDIVEHQRFRGLLQMRAKELKCATAFNNVLKALDKEVQNSYNYGTKSVKGVAITCNSDGKPFNTIENFLAIIRADENFSGLQFNQLSYAPEKYSIENGIERWMDADDSWARQYIESEYHLHNKDKLDDALRIRFKECEYHPIKKVIDAVEWDGEERIETLLVKWLKCEDSAYTREVSRLIFAGGINRLYDSGCKFDDVPVLIGTKQGEGKSTFVRWLALQDEFFTEVTEFEGQKGMEALEGAWICEIAELLALTRSKDVEAVKSYLSRQVDRYRRPFDRRVTDHKRQCTFIGTTNKEQFLTDKTGNRRFYPVKVHQTGYDLFAHEAEIKADILQCWAEAKAKMLKGEMPPFAKPELMPEIRRNQQCAVEDDWRDGLIEDYLKDKHEVCILELWQRALGNDFSKPTKKDSNEIALILQGMPEWKKASKSKTMSGYGVQKFWIRKPTEEELLDVI